MIRKTSLLYIYKLNVQGLLPFTLRIHLLFRNLEALWTFPNLGNL